MGGGSFFNQNQGKKNDSQCYSLSKRMLSTDLTNTLLDTSFKSIGETGCNLDFMYLAINVINNDQY